MGRFVKGQSGNPGGRPKELSELGDLCRKWTIDTAHRIREIVETSENPVAVCRAWELLSDRGFGRPAQTLTHENPDGTPLSIIVATAIPAESDDDQPAVH